MDRLKGFSSSLMGAANQLMDQVDKSKFGEKINYLKDSYLNKVYEIGYRRFTVKKLIAEGGFGFVFLVREVGTEKQYALKRMLVQDRDRIGAVKNEVNLMKILSRNPNVVSLEDHRMIDNRTELEVLLLMEFCSCSLLDVMNRGGLRGEQDIYNVFSQVCTAVACLHSNNPPISHRDLKVENILLGEDGNWKLCDFGSATTTTYLPTSERERSIAEEDINRNTTMMYRAPEMVDLYRRQKINEKVDIWALGCVLYKMAYLTDPFDGGLGILNARYTFPEFRKTTSKFEEFIAFLLNSDPELRPSIQQVQERLATLRGVPVSKPAPTSNNYSNGNNYSSNGNNYSNGNTYSSGNTYSNNNNNNNNSYGNHSAPANNRPSQNGSNQSARPAPVTRVASSDLLDWESGPATSNAPRQNAQPATQPPANLHNSAPLPHHPKVAPNQQRSTTPNPSKPVALFDSLDWQYSNSSSGPNQTATQPSKPSGTTQKPPTSQANQSSHPPQQQSASMDLLDFSDPPAQSKPPVPSGFFSPQVPRSSYYPPPATNPYFSPNVTRNVPQSTTPPPYDPLAQFATPKQKSVDIDDFDPLAPKKPNPQPSLPSGGVPVPPSSKPKPLPPHQAVRSNSQSLINF